MAPIAYSGTRPLTAVPRRPRTYSLPARPRLRREDAFTEKDFPSVSTPLTMADYTYFPRCPTPMNSESCERGVSDEDSSETQTRVVDDGSAVVEREDANVAGEQQAGQDSNLSGPAAGNAEDEGNQDHTTPRCGSAPDFSSLHPDDRFIITQGLSLLNQPYTLPPNAQANLPHHSTLTKRPIGDFVSPPMKQAGNTCSREQKSDAEQPSSGQAQTPQQAPREGTHLFCKHAWVYPCYCRTPLKPDGQGDYCDRCWAGECEGPPPPNSGVTRPEPREPESDPHPNSYYAARRCT